MGWRDQAQGRVKDKKAGTSYTMEPGDNTFRILPNKRGTDHPPYLEYRVHNKVGPEKTWVTCGKSISGEGQCYICDKLIPSLEASASEQKRMMAKVMRPEDKLLLQVSPIDPKTKKFMAPKPYWAPYSGGKSLGVAILARLADPTRSPIDDPKKGRNLTVERTGQLLKTRYGSLMVDEEASAVPPAILAAMKPIEDLKPKYDPRRQLAAWKGEKFQATPTANAVEEDNSNEEDYQLGEDQVEEGAEFTEEGADDSVEAVEDAEEFGEEPELEPDPEEALPDDELGEFAEGFEDVPEDNEYEPEEVPPPAPPRRVAPKPQQRQVPRAAAKPAAPPPKRTAAAASATPARSTARPPLKPAPKGGKPTGRR